MAKISDLPVIDAPTGAELVVVSDPTDAGRTKGAKMGNLMRGAAATAVQPLFPAAYPLAYDFDPYGAAADGSYLTSNATILLGKNFDELGPVANGCIAYISAIEVFRYTGDANATTPVTIRKVRHRRPEGRMDSVAVIASDLTLQPGRNRFELGRDFDFIAVAPGETIAIYSPHDGIMRRAAPGDLQGLPYVMGKAEGQDVALSYDIAANLMLSVELRYAPASAQDDFLLFSFVDHDPADQGTPDYQGRAFVRRGIDGGAFLQNLRVVMVDQPAGHGFRDPCPRMDPSTGTIWVSASAHNVVLGQGRDTCDVYRADIDGDTVTLTWLATIQSGVPGAVGMWAPEILPIETGAPLRIIVSVMMPDPSIPLIGAAGKPYLYESTSLRGDQWTLVGPVTGPALPPAMIDGTMMRVAGRWLLAGVDITALPNESIFLAEGPGPLGPFTSLAPAPLFGRSDIEGPQLVIDSPGVLRLYYDAFAGAGMRYRESRDLGLTWGPETPVVVGNFINRAGQSVYFAPRHGGVLRIPRR